MRADGNPALTHWNFIFYGGMLLSGDPAGLNETTREIGSMTGSRRVVGMLYGRAVGAT